MARRLFKVQINLDDMASELDRYSRDDQLAEWLRGFRRGTRGYEPVGDGAYLCGHEFGHSCYVSAMKFHDAQAIKGKASAAIREAKFGTSNPRTDCEPRFNHGSTTVQPRLEPAVNLSSNQYPITNNQKANSQYPTGSEAEPVGPIFLLRSGVGVRLCRGEVETLENSFPNAPMELEIASAASWTHEKPGRAPEKGIFRFMANWLKKSCANQIIETPENDGPSEDAIQACIEEMARLKKLEESKA